VNSSIGGGERPAIAKVRHCKDLRVRVWDRVRVRVSVGFRISAMADRNHP